MQETPLVPALLGILLGWWIWTGLWILLHMRAKRASDRNLAEKQRTWPVVVGLIFQPFFYVIFLYSYPALMYVSVWVVQGPVLLLLLISLVAPTIYVRPFSARAYLRNVAIGGWLFVTASFVWVQAYWFLSKQDGTPVSWSEVQKWNAFMLSPHGPNKDPRGKP